MRKVGGVGFEPTKGEAQQIYSLPPLAAWVPAQTDESRRADSNRQPADYKSAALPVELRRLDENFKGRSGRETARERFTLL